MKNEGNFSDLENKVVPDIASMQQSFEEY